MLNQEQQAQLTLQAAEEKEKQSKLLHYVIPEFLPFIRKKGLFNDLIKKLGDVDALVNEEFDPDDRPTLSFFYLVKECTVTGKSPAGYSYVLPLWDCLTFETRCKVLELQVKTQQSLIKQAQQYINYAVN